jgi:hypothetical protein
MSDTPRDHKGVEPFIKASRRSEILAKLAAQAASLVLAANVGVGVAQASTKSSEVTKGHAETHAAGQTPRARTLRPGMVLANDTLPAAPLAKSSKDLTNDGPTPKGKETKETKDVKDVKDVKDTKDTKDTKDVKDTKDTKEGKDAKDTKETKETKEGKDAKDTKEVTTENKQLKEFKEEKETKESEDGKLPDLSPTAAVPVPTAYETEFAPLHVDGAIWAPLSDEAGGPRLKPATLLMRKPIV